MPVVKPKEEKSSGFGLFDKIYRTLWKGETKEEKEIREKKEAERDRKILYGVSAPLPTSVAKAEPRPSANVDYVQRYRKMMEAQRRNAPQFPIMNLDRGSFLSQ